MYVEALTSVHLVYLNFYFGDISLLYYFSSNSEKLVKCYEKQGFDVRLCENLIKLEMDQVMKEIAVMDHSQKDCLVCNILSHGDADNVYGSDGMKFPIQELLKIFKADSCPSLENKPKMFFIQACRKDTSSIQGQYDTNAYIIFFHKICKIACLS